MEIKNSFDVPLQPEEAWKVLMDVPLIVPCMPGAELIGRVDERTYKGKVAVKLGPVTLTFTGSAQFEDIDDLAKTARLRAQGSDNKGRGQAAAVVQFHLEPIPEGSRVNVATDVILTGSVAQYGRAAGLMQSVASQLVGQFADCLREMLTLKDPVPVIDSSEALTAAPSEPRAHPPNSSKPISGFTLLFRAIWTSIRDLFTSRR